MKVWKRRPGLTRAQLIDRKHALEAEIADLAAHARRIRARGGEARDLEARLERLRGLHYRTRLEIDRTGPAT
jgi:hypothetical protein